MEVVLRGRGEGKTRRAADWLYEGRRERVLFVPTRREAEWIDHPDVVVWSDERAKERLRGRRVDSVGIDGLDRILTDMLQAPIGLVTMNWTPATEPRREYGGYIFGRDMNEFMREEMYRERMKAVVGIKPSTMVNFTDI